MPNSELANLVYLPSGQRISGNCISKAGRTLRRTLPELNRLVAHFGQGEVFPGAGGDVTLPRPR